MLSLDAAQQMGLMEKTTKILLAGNEKHFLYRLLKMSRWNESSNFETWIYKFEMVGFKIGKINNTTRTESAKNEVWGQNLQLSDN